MYQVYVLKNQETGKIYIGQTNNLEKRLSRHNGFLPTKARSYTKINKGLWKIAYNEEYETRKEALIREKYLKSHVGRNWLKNILAR